MRNKNDMIGRKFGRLTVIKQIKREGSKNSLWSCDCDCGNNKIYKKHELINGSKTSCGCEKYDDYNKYIKKDMIFGDYKTVEFMGKNAYGCDIWECICKNNHNRITRNSKELKDSRVLNCIECKLLEYKKMIGKKVGTVEIVSIYSYNAKGCVYNCVCSCDKNRIFQLSKSRIESGVSNCGKCCNRGENLVGKRYGKLVVEKEVKDDLGHKAWLCRCDCGGERIASTRQLKKADVKTCGCYKREIEDLKDKVFGRLKVVSYHGKINKAKEHSWNCVCECGNKVLVTHGNLLRGSTRSCGCLLEDINDEVKEKVLKKLETGIKSIGGKIIGEYINKETKIMCVFGDVEYSTTARVFINDVIPRTQQVLKKISKTKDEMIGFVVVNGCLNVLIKTFDGGEIAVTSKKYKEIIKRRKEFYDIVKRRKHKCLNPFINASVDVGILLEDGITIREISPYRYIMADGDIKEVNFKSKRVKMVMQEIANENGDKILGEYVNMRTPILIHFACGHIATTRPDRYIAETGCPKCPKSRGEEIIMKHLDEIGIEYDNRVRLANNKEYDIIVPMYNLYIEVHGRQHYEEVEFFKKTLAEEQANDLRKKRYILEVLNANYMEVDYREHKPELALERFQKQFAEFLKEKE